MITKVTNRDFIKTLFEQFKNAVNDPNWGILRVKKSEQQDKLKRLLELDQNTCSITEIAEIMSPFADSLFQTCSGCGNPVTSYFHVTNQSDPYYFEDICFECVEKMHAELNK